MKKILLLSLVLLFQGCATAYYQHVGHQREATYRVRQLGDPQALRMLQAGVQPSQVLRGTVTGDEQALTLGLSVNITALDRWKNLTWAERLLPVLLDVGVGYLAYENRDRLGFDGNTRGDTRIYYIDADTVLLGSDGSTIQQTTTTTRTTNGDSL